MLSNTKLARIIHHKGFRLQEKEIAKQVGVGVKTVSYHLHRLRRESEQNPDIFWGIIAGRDSAGCQGR